MSPRKMKQDVDGEARINTRARAKRLNDCTIDIDKERTTTKGKPKTGKKKKDSPCDDIVSITKEECLPKLTPTIDSIGQTKSSQTNDVVLQLFFNDTSNREEIWHDRKKQYAPKARSSLAIVNPTITPVKSREVAPHYSRIPSTLPAKKKRSKTSLGSSKRTVLTFSKSPKIVLRSPKPKTRKSKSPKASRQKTTKSKRSLGESEGSSAKKAIFPGSNVTAETKDKSSFHTKLSQSLNSKMQDKESPLMAIINSCKPVVVLQRLQLVETSSQNSEIKPGNAIEDVSTDFSKTSPFYSSDTLRKSKPASKKHAPLMTDRETRSRSRNISLNSPPSKLTMIQSLNNDDRDALTNEINNATAATPLMSSTPQGEQRDSVETKAMRDRTSKEAKSEYSFSNDRPDVSSRAAYFNRSDYFSESVTNVRRSSIRNKKESFDGSRTRSKPNFRNEVTLTLEDTEREDEKCNQTYEVLEPKTPRLREKSRKHSLSGITGQEQKSKRSSKVRLRSSITSMKGSANRIQTFCNSNNNGPRLNTAASGNGIVKADSLVDDRRQKSNFSDPKREIGSTKIEVNTPRQNNEKSNSQIGASTTPFSNKKLDAKYSVKKKLPNFREIHKKLFAKAESIVDAKKRLEERHNALSNSSTKVKSLMKRSTTCDLPPREQSTANVLYNRFGYKLRKVEATNCILKKHHPPSRVNRQRENRAMLKGVRTNRRFELQMKCRNIEI